MVKRNVKIQRSRKTNKNRSSSLSNSSNPTFGAVSTITTAPVAIGNSMHGAQAQVTNKTADSCRVVGRDYAFTAASTGTLTGWCNVGGFALTPAGFVSSILRSYTQMYNKFKFNNVVVHYITSSATTSTGDVMFHVVKNRTDPTPNNTASTFLSYVLSDPNTVIGPQWTNHSAVVKPTGGFRNLVSGSNLDYDYQSQGEVFLYSKTASTDSPGYVIIDYDISFKELSLNPRAGALPNGNIIYQPVQLVLAAAACTTNSTILSWSTGTRWLGNTSITNLTATPDYKIGDIYKFTIDATNTNSSAWTSTAGTTPTLSTLMNPLIENITQVGFTITDGMTIYVVCTSSGFVRLLPNAASTASVYGNTSSQYLAGFTGTIPVYGEAAGVPNAGVWLYGLISWVGNALAANLQQTP